ncbi:MAG TPA: hypothetical protein VHZ24_10410 [Pirellulales bacterium]|nr:hypothetical protein [Pirellulales bacterium]
MTAAIAACSATVQAGNYDYPVQHPEYKPGGCWHYGWHYNPCADYGPYWTGRPRPVLRAIVRTFSGVPYPGYYYGPMPWGPFKD